MVYHAERSAKAFTQCLSGFALRASFVFVHFFILILMPFTSIKLTRKLTAAAKLAEFPGVFVRIIPSAASLFNVQKLNLKRNNIHNLNTGLCLQHLYSYIFLDPDC